MQWARSLGFINGASKHIPEIVEATQFTHCPIGTIRLNENSFQQKNMMSVDESFIKMFEVESLVGDLNDISKPNTAFISEDFAKIHFENENPIGKTIKIESLQYFQDVGEYQIRGIVKNTHPKTHFEYHILLSQKGSLQERFNVLPNRKTHWVYNYIKLKNEVSPALVADKFLSIYNESSLRNVRGPEDYKFNLIALADIHLKSDYRFELKESTSKINIGLFITISFVILFVSLFNFINLNLTKLIKKSKELGLYRAVGAHKKQIIEQVLVDVLVHCSAAILVSLFLLKFIGSQINQFFEIDFNIYYSEPIIYLTIIGVLAICGALSTLFVGFFLLRKTTTVQLLTKKDSSSGNFSLKALIVLQICIVIVLMSCTIIVNKQIDFMSTKSLGFEKENVVVIHFEDFSKDPTVFANELKKNTLIKSVGFTRQYFGYPTQDFQLEGFGIDGSADFVLANYDYIKTMNIQLLHNWISPSADTVEGMLINEHLFNRLLEKHGTIEALETYAMTHNLDQNDNPVKILGVAKDFNYNSAHEAVGDFAFLLGESPSRARFTHIRIRAGNTREGLDITREVWNKHYPNQEFSYFFIDEKIAQQYKAEEILGRILFTFSIIGILISIVGITALALFISQQRTKEMGIRRVNGASISEILIMLNKDFIKWVAIAFAIAVPIAWYVMNQWLQNFAYRIGLSWWIFALAGFVALLIVLITVSFQVFKLARRNPVEALRYE
ncbi:FtsX-like permease family protein [Lentimicrobium sp. L6]|nr:FtsX-like permease family protein [Lentimicrobium sp. S6]NPD84740.1 FtsX-like permease family protein [Lentimicrobium sp. L6]